MRKSHKNNSKGMDSNDSLFSSGKPKKTPWFFIPVLIGIAILVILYKWFN